MKKKLSSLIIVLFMFTLLMPIKVVNAATLPVLNNGSTGSEVVALQHLLNDRGYGLSADGIFGSGTESAVKKFQTANSLTSDGIVGSNTWSKLFITVQNGSNNNAVKAVQYLLSKKFGYSLTTDGIFGSGTHNAVVAFQTSKGLSADGIVGANTWTALLATSSTTPPTSDFWAARSSWLNPLKYNSPSGPSSAGYFGAARANGRIHAGVDFVTSGGTPVYAMTSGKVINRYNFYQNTDAIEVLNTDGTVARYCEISPTVTVGQTVSRGTQIGTVKTNLDGTAMLHLEVYMGTSTGSLTDTTNSTYKYVTDRNYQRRSDLVDPTGAFNLKKS